MFMLPPDHLPQWSDFPQRMYYDFPGYDAPHRPVDLRPYVPLVPIPPGMQDFRTQRQIYDYGPPSPAPASPVSPLGMTLNSLPANVTARMGGFGG